MLEKEQERERKRFDCAILHHSMTMTAPYLWHKLLQSLLLCINNRRSSKRTNELEVDLLLISTYNNRSTTCTYIRIFLFFRKRKCKKKTRKVWSRS